MSDDSTKEGKRAAEKVDIFMPMYWGDYLADTMEFSTIEHGCYLLLIAHYWRLGRGPEMDMKRLRQVCRLPPGGVKSSISKALRCFEIIDGHLYHKRIEQELEKARKRKEQAKKASNKRWGNDAPAYAGAMQMHMQMQSSSPSPSHIHRPSNDERCIHPEGNQGRKVYESKEEKSPSPLFKNCEWLRLSEKEFENYQNWFNRSNLESKLLGFTILALENWLATGASKKAKGARTDKSHYRRLQAPWVIENATKLARASATRKFRSGPTNEAEKKEEFFANFFSQLNGEKPNDNRTDSNTVEADFKPVA